jgi:RND family efflux transporter MFP subunit
LIRHAGSILGLSLAVAGLNACGPSAPGGPAAGGAPSPAAAAGEPVEVTLAPVLRLPVERTLAITGTLHGREEATVSAKVGGRVSEVVVDLGDPAPSGARIIQIDPTDYTLAAESRRAALAAALARLGLTDLPPADFDIGQVPTVGRARAEEANALAREQRARELFEQTPPLISEQEYADIRTQAEVASWSARVEALTAGATLAEARAQGAQLAAAEQQLADTTVRAPAPAAGEPIPYHVSERLVSLGELVTPGQALVRLVASDVLRFRGEVPERYIGRVRAGQTARIELEGAGEPVAGAVTRVAPAIDLRTRTFAVEIEVINADGALRPGGFARAEIVTGVDQGVPHVPRAAVASFAGVQRVFGVRDGKAVGVVVTTGPARSGPARDALVELAGDIELSEVIARVGPRIADAQPVLVVGAEEREALADP